MIKKNDKITTKFDNIVVVKQVYSFVGIYYSNFKVIDINIDKKSDELNIYLERQIINQYKDIITLQKEILEYLKSNLEYEIGKINIIKF